MFTRNSILLLLFTVILFLSCSSAEPTNQDVSISVEAVTAVVRLNMDIKTINVDGEYRLIFQNDWANNLAYLSVTLKGKELKVSAPVSNSNFTTFIVDTKKENSPNLKVQAVFTGMLTPYPAEITQNENQFVLLSGSHYFYSPYPTTSQKSVFKLATSSIESFTKVSPHSTRGSSLHFGPFKDIAAFEFSPLTIHYMNNNPFAKMSSMVREVEVSHWGNIAVEEIYELKHAGAVLKGGFSRFDYQMRRSAPSPSFRSLVAQLPAQAHSIYYRDQIGNISTSDIRTSKSKDLELEIQTRFPIFGGWQTQFYLGYSIPTELALFHEPNGMHNLRFDFFTIFQDVWVEDMELKVILPEGCTDIDVSVPYPVEQSRAVRYTFLDSKANGGRPVIIIKAHNLVEEHDQQVIVSYKFNSSRMMVEPLMVVGSFFAIFMLLSLFARTTAISNEVAKPSS